MKKKNIPTSNSTSKKDHSLINNTKSISISNMRENIFRYKRLKK